MSFSPLDNQEDGSPIANPPRVTMCLDKEFEDDPPKSENMKVYARVRPMLQREEDEGYRECIAAIDEETIRAVVPANSVKFKNSGLNPQDVYDFKYSQAFGPDVGQFLFFENTIMDAMLGYIEGQNSLIFNYGITNSGKTYTLQGNEANPGIIPLAMHLFFGCIEKQLMDEICVKPEKFCDIVVLNDRERAQELRLKEELLRLVDNDSFNKTSASDTSVVSNASKSFSQILCECFRDDFKYQTETTLPPEEMIAAQSAAYMRELGKKSVDEQPGKCNIWVSFIEIYNEYICDLLQPNIAQRQKPSLAEDQNGDVYIKGAREICVANSTEAIKLMYVGRKNLRIASTKLNYQSSRSHCIFTVKIARVFDDETHGTSGRVNKISFCDLAGSERANKSQTSGMRLKEAGYINTSLMVLGRCLDQLRRNQTAKYKKMIPFRESKLTRLFSNHFLGKGKAVMIANASPCEYTFDETLNVLRFSALAKDLTISDSYISTAQNSIMDICNQWHKSKNRVSDVSANESYDLDSLYTEEIEKRDEMIEKLVDVAESLRQNLEQEKKERVELEFKIREEVGNEKAKYSDELLDEQKKSYERQIESLRDLYKQWFDAMKETYEKKIHELQEELNESDDSFENSISEINKTFDKIEEESLISFSPAVGEPSKQVLKAEVNVSVDTSMDFFDAVGEDQSKANSDIQSLKEDLESISKELSITKQQLEETSKSLKESQTEGAVAKEKSDALNCKLLEANQVLEEYRKELEQLKSNCESCENEIDSLLEEKKCLQDNVLTLSDQLAQSETKAEQFNKEKCEIEESSSQKLAEKEKNAANSVIESLRKEKLDIEKSFAKEKEEMLNENSDVAEQCKNLKSSLETAIKDIEDKKLKIYELESEMESLETSYKTDNLELQEKLDDLKRKLASVSDMLGEAKIVNEKSKELGTELETIILALDEEKSKVAELVSKCSAYESEKARLLKDLEEAEEKLKLQIEQTCNSNETDECENLDESSSRNSQVFEQNSKIAELELKIKELESSCATYKSDNSELMSDLKNLQEKLDCVCQELEESKSANERSREIGLEMEKISENLKEEKSKADELLCKCDCLETENAKLLQDIKTYEENSTLEKANDQYSAKIEELTLKLDEINRLLEEKQSKIDQLDKGCSYLKSENADLLKTLDAEKEKYIKLSDEQGKLLQVLEKCEFSATQKVKLLHSSSIKNLDELADLNRQVREKETSIEELERALCDCQKQLKESEAKAKKQMHAIKQQHSIEIEEMAHLKKLVEEENLQLKATVTELEKKEDSKKEDIKEDVKNDEAEEDINKEDEKKEETMKQSSSNLSKGKKKRSLSEVSKEKTVEEKVTKRRRVLRQRQDTAVINTASNSESEEEISKPNFKKEENDDEYVPSTKATIRKKVPSKGRSRQPQKKTSEEMPKVPTTRTTRRKIQDDTENVSPVKKAMAFVGSKLRSVAQTVTNMPSPRITRGRRKLYNADAAKPRWKL